MEEGPTSYCPDRPAQETAEYLAEHKVLSVLVTTNGGELIGLFYRDDVERRSHNRAPDARGEQGSGGALGRNCCGTGPVGTNLGYLEFVDGGAAA